jgi:cystine transport system substrate-binding protein
MDFRLLFQRQIVGCLLAAVASASWAQTTDILATSRAQGVIRIANTQSSPPWTYVGDDNKPAGYDVEVAKEVARRIGVARIEFIADSGKNFVEGLKAGKYDLVMNDMTPTPEREKQVDFSAPYGVEDFRVFVRKPSDIQGTAELRGKRVGVTTGSSNEAWARSNLPQSEIVTYDNGALVFNDLAVGRIDATISSYFGGTKYAADKKLPITEVGPILTYQLSAAAMPKNQPALKAAVSKAVDEMIADGTIDRLSKRWVGVSYGMAAEIARARR